MCFKGRSNPQCLVASCVIIFTIALMCLYNLMDGSNGVAPLMMPAFTQTKTKTKTPVSGEQAFTTVSVLKGRAEYSKRLHEMTLACMKLNRTEPRLVSSAVIDPKTKVDIEHAIIYCNIPKIGSTFWTRVLFVMGSRGKYSSPFQLRLMQARLPTFAYLKSQLSHTQMESFLSSASSFLFVREPYGRLLSGYVDKLYNPNKGFWKSVGIAVVRAVRQNATTASLTHGHDVTFAEFVKSLIKMNKAGGKINAHFKPMHQKCDPCKYKYDFIGKIETFREDAAFLLGRWRSLHGNIHVKFENFEEETDADTAKGHVRFLFKSRNFVSNVSYPVYNLLLRTWRNMQIRGKLSKNIRMPISPSEAETISRETFTDILLEAMQAPVDRTRLKLQREEALIQAYQTVSLEDMEELRKFVLKDCQYFGYNDRPEKLFSSSGRTAANSFNYFAGLTDTPDTA